MRCCYANSIHAQHYQLLLSEPRNGWHHHIGRISTPGGLELPYLRRPVGLGISWLHPDDLPSVPGNWRIRFVSNSLHRWTLHCHMSSNEIQGKSWEISRSLNNEIYWKILQEYICSKLN
jgi:hypothetical protein